MKKQRKSNVDPLEGIPGSFVVPFLMGFIVFIAVTIYFEQRWWAIDLDSTITEVEYVPPEKVRLKAFDGRKIFNSIEIPKEDLFWQITKNAEVEVSVINRIENSENILLYASFNNDKDTILHKLKFIPKKPAIVSCNGPFFDFGVFDAKTKEDKVIFYCKCHVSEFSVYMASSVAAFVAWLLCSYIMAVMFNTRRKK